MGTYTTTIAERLVSLREKLNVLEQQLVARAHAAESRAKKTATLVSEVETTLMEIDTLANRKAHFLVTSTDKMLADIRSGRVTLIDTETKEELPVALFA